MRTLSSRTPVAFCSLALLSLSWSSARAQSLLQVASHPALTVAAQDDLFDEEGAGAPERAESVEPREATGGGDAFAGTTGFVRPQGFYTSSDLGGFIRFGGWADGEDCGFRCKSRITSNLQPYIGLSVGYDLNEFVAVQVSYGTGFVANAAPLQGIPDSPRDYGVTFTNAALLASYYFDRVGIVGKISGGAAFLGPAPTSGAPFAGGNVGGGVGVRWATLLTDVTVGLDVNGVFVFVPGGTPVSFPALSVAPILQYTF